jgi:hypothetical protein
LPREVRSVDAEAHHELTPPAKKNVLAATNISGLNSLIVPLRVLFAQARRSWIDFCK